MAEAVWAATGPVERIRQRAFFTFGMDLLLSLNLFQVGSVGGRVWSGVGRGGMVLLSSLYLF